MEKPGSNIVHCLEFESHFHMELQILCMTVILPGNHKCLHHSHCGRPKIKGRPFFASSYKREEIDVGEWREGHKQWG